MLKAARVVLVDGEIYEDVYVIPGDISLCIVLAEETLDITRESVKMVTYTDLKSSWMIRTMAMGLLLDTFEEVQETLLDLEMQAEEVQSYIEAMHADATGQAEAPPAKAKSPYE